MGNFYFYFLQVENILSKKFQLIFFYAFFTGKNIWKKIIDLKKKKKKDFEFFLS